MAKDFWQNNKISKILNEKYKHDFSICDIDGVCRHNIKVGDDIFKRFIIYESKHHNENISQTQLETLYDIDINMNWKNFDEGSGVYLIKHYGETEFITMCKIVIDPTYVKQPYYVVVEIFDTTLEEFYNFITHKKNNIEQHFINKTFTYKTKKINI